MLPCDVLTIYFYARSPCLICLCRTTCLGWSLGMRIQGRGNVPMIPNRRTLQFSLVRQASFIYMFHSQAEKNTESYQIPYPQSLTFLFSYCLTSADGNLYAGVHIDFMSTDAALFRTMGGRTAIRTEQYDSRWLNGE